MICYEVQLNGRRLCVAGAPGYGVLGTNLTWVKRSPERRRKGEPRAAYGVEEHFLQVGGLFEDEHLDWISSRRIRTGDIVRIRVLRRATADRPIRRMPVERRETLKAKRAQLARLQDAVRRLRRDIRRAKVGTLRPTS